jgi:hypothetical protein
MRDSGRKAANKTYLNPKSYIPNPRIPEPPNPGPQPCPGYYQS